MLQVNNLEAVYQKIILALRGMSLHVPEGKIVALLGSNGAGKSTTLKAISGLLSGDGGRVTDGTIEFQGEAINSVTPDVLVKKGIFLSMEGRRVFKDLTVEENLKLCLDIQNNDSNISEALERVGLKGFEKKKVRALSGGEKQRVAIARALIKDCKVIFADEPTSVPITAFFLSTNTAVLFPCSSFSIFTAVFAVVPVEPATIAVSTNVVVVCNILFTS